MTDIMPDQMDRWSRNQHLYEALKGMGLCVTAIPEADDSSKIRQILVSADRPFAVEAAARQVKVAEVLREAESRGGNVINFPGRF